jgi:transcriptional regulator with GAF, ATPase, and Fis domain
MLRKPESSSFRAKATNSTLGTRGRSERPNSSPNRPIRNICANSFAGCCLLETHPPEIDDGLIGESAPMQKLRAQLRQFAASPFPVLIEGESGSGKELAAAALHRLSERAAKPYLALNCAAISPSLVEATLFGHSKGAFTGASGSRAGYFEDASDGTLFLDEIGELPLDLQPKLLRVLENGEFQRIGETQARHSSARIIAATNRDLKKEVREGRFRADLYHRLSVFTIAIPALRDSATTASACSNTSARSMRHRPACHPSGSARPPPNACSPTDSPAMSANCAI